MQQQSCLVSDFWCNLTESACQRHLTWSCSCQAMVLCYLISSLQHSRCPLSRRQVQWLPSRHTEIFSLSLLNIRVLTSIGKPRFFTPVVHAINSWQWTQTMSHLSNPVPDKTEWRLISATLCRWRCCFVADQLWFMTRIREEEQVNFYTFNIL